MLLFALGIYILLFNACEKNNDINQEENKSWSEIKDGLRFRIWTDKYTYKENEQIILFVEFENTSSEDKVILIKPQQIPVLSDQAPLYDINKIIVTNNENGDSNLELVPVESNMLNVVPEIAKLEPKETSQEKTQLNLNTFWTDKKVFENAPFQYTQFLPKQGKYTLQAIYTWDELPYNSSDRVAQIEEYGVPLWKGFLESGKIQIRVVSD